MRTLSNHRTTSGLLACAIVLFWVQNVRSQQEAEPAYALGNAPFSDAAPAEHRAISPFNPVHFVPKLDFFGPVDSSDYGNGPPPKYGFFGSYERLLWDISRPSPAVIGSPTAPRVFQEAAIDISTQQVSGLTSVFETNNTDTGILRDHLGWGNRWEFGYMDTDNHGWLVGVTEHVAQNQLQTVNRAVILFNDPNNLLKAFTPFVDPVTGATIDADLNGNGVFGRYGRDLNGDKHPDVGAPTDFGDAHDVIPRFTALQIANNTLLNSVEVLRTYRAPHHHEGGVLEVMYGVRYFQIDDRFTLIGTGSPFDITSIFSRANNNIVGPEIAGRYSHQRGRWIFSSEGRLMAGVDLQTVRVKSQLASNSVRTTGNLYDPNLFGPSGSDHSLRDSQFSPGVDIRLHTAYQVTQQVALKFGYTGLFFGGISRASNRIDYTFPDVNVLKGNTHQNIYINGLDFGIEINR